MLEIIVVIFGFVVFGFLTYILVKDTYEARKLYRRKIKALEEIATELYEIRKTKRNVI